MGMEINVIGTPSRSLPQGIADGIPTARDRFGRYMEDYVLSLVPSKHLLADEGSYFVANNLQTAITGQTTAAYDATKPSLLIYNGNTNNNTKRIYLDYIALRNGGTAYSNASSNTGMFCSCALDNVNRYSSGGTALTVQGTNLDEQRTSAASVWAGAIVTAAASALKTITSERLFRMPVSSTVLTLPNVDQWLINFGGIDPTMALPNQASATLEATAIGRVINFPAMVIGPGQCFLWNLNCIAGGAVTAGNLFYEVGWFER